ncbi:MAG: CotH kinase family protein, partial [Oscillospiraceae bacterium]|nr:CotH kinase family protein [Candidatus Equicaccousia limihippi]
GVDIIDKEYTAPQKQVQTPAFSTESGFYDNPFYLKINIPDGAKVYYTLDSSDPDEQSTEYTSPIYLDDATGHKNVYSMRTDVTAGFYSELLKNETALPDQQYAAPDYSVDKCNIVRAVAVYKDGTKSEIVTKSYFVGKQAADFGDVNVITITSDPDNLFSSDKGIYVTGDYFSRYLKMNKISEEKRPWLFWDSNYTQRGKEWQRKASISFFDNNGKLMGEQPNGAIRIHGHGSRGLIPRSFNLYAEDGGDITDGFKADLFGNGFHPSCVTLSSGGNRVFTKLNDVFITDRCSQLNYSNTDYKPYVLFLDGEYWGFYWLSEKYDENYLHYHYGVDTDNVVIIKNNAVDAGGEVYKSLYSNMINDITKSDMTTATAYKNACKLVDIESFTDYYATMAYISRQEDWPQTNFALWRTVEKRGGKYSDGKWRWLMFDCNSTCMRTEIIDFNSIDLMVQQDKLFAAFWKNADFREKFKNRLQEMSKGCFNSNEVKRYVERYDREMYGILEKSWTRFHGKNNNKEIEYREEMDGYIKFFEQRPAVIASWFDKNK